jgi:asparagine synthase (glutamine-hydrolysing)
MTPISIFLAIIIASYGLVFLIRRWASRMAIFDIPNERSSHTTPTPRGGGLAIVVITLAVVLIFSLLNGGWQKSLFYLAGGAILAFLGWRDDVRSMPARVRFLVQGLVAIGTITGLGYFDALPFPFIGRIELGILGILLTIIWIVGLTNAFNFMDGIDGIAGGVAATAGFGWVVLIQAGGGTTTGLAFWIALAIAAASLGFLLQNWSPAKIFLGDVGSVFLGYSFAVLPLLVENNTVQPLMPGILVVWVFIIDAGVTFIGRAYRHERLFSAHRSHLYQRMVIGGMSHAAVSSIYIILTILGVLLARGWISGDVWSHWLILIGIPLFWCVFYYAGTRKDGWIKLTAYFSLYRSMGLDWALFRLKYVLRQKTGNLRRESPAYDWSDVSLSTWIKPEVPSDINAFARWRMQNAPRWFFGTADPIPDDVPWDAEKAVQDAERVLAGEWQYFSHDWLKTGFPPDWHTDPVTGYHFDPTVHWSEIDEYGNYDIKYVWEASRLSMVHTLVRAYAKKPNERYPEAFWKLVENWMEHNPPGSGVNWIDGQEAALRLMAICFGYYAFRTSTASTPERIGKLTCLAGALGGRIYENLDFAIHSRTNHAISVTFGIWLSGMVFPELKNAEKYLNNGKEMFEQEVAKQILPDGGYAMYSINYHRFVLHLLCTALRLGELNDQRFSDATYQKLSDSAGYLSQLVVWESGETPGYGSNDGALALPMDTCDYTDFRPVLQLANFVAHGQRLLGSGPWDEDLFWLAGAGALQAELADPPTMENAAFEDAGVYVMHGENSKAVLHCTGFKGRPSHADQLHMDMWWQGVNIVCDAGTYLYHGEGIWQNGLAHTGVHNTVCVDGVDQMLKLSRFTWGNWAQGRALHFGEMDGKLTWQAEHVGYLRLPDPVKHVRTVTRLGNDAWMIEDHLTGKQMHQYSLQWLLKDLPYELLKDSYGLKIIKGGQRLMVEMGMESGTGDFTVIRAEPNSTRGWVSKYYGAKEPAVSIMLNTRQAAIRFWTKITPEGVALPAIRLSSD